MSSETSKTGRTISLAGNQHDIYDQGVPVQHVDVLLEVGSFQGSVHIGLGAYIHEMGNKGIVDAVCRLRMSPTTAQTLRAALDVAIKDVLKPIPNEKRN